MLVNVDDIANMYVPSRLDVGIGNGIFITGVFVFVVHARDFLIRKFSVFWVKSM